MKKILRALFGNTKKKQLAHKGDREFKRKDLSKSVADTLLTIAKEEDLNALCDRLQHAYKDTNERMALFGFGATTYSVGLSMIAVLEQFGSVGTERKKCQDNTCRLGPEHEAKLIDTLRNLPDATNFSKVSPIRKFLDDWQHRPGRY